MSIAAAICLVYVVVLLAERARVIPRVLPSAVTSVGTALRIQQTWNMFAPDPATATSRFEVRRTLSDGTRLVEPATSRFRWTVYVGRAGGSHPPGHPLARSFRLFAERQCNWHDTGAGGRLVDEVAIIVHSREITDEGLGPDQTRLLVETSCL